MGAALYDSEPHYRDAIDRCAALLEPHLGLDIRAIMFADDSSDRINETRYAQPALFCTEYALATLWMQWGVSPHAMIGHSIGEYVAAHLAGVFSLADVVAVVAARGRLMQALPPGSMAAVHLPASELAPRLGGGVEIAAENAPGLCTISGAREAMADALRRLEARGVDCRPLHTSHAFHSSMMDPALPPFVALLQNVRLSPPTIPYVSNVTGTWITAEQATAADYYATHLRQPVRFEVVRSNPRGRSRTVLPGGRTGEYARHPDTGDAWRGAGRHHHVVVVSSAPAGRRHADNAGSGRQALAVGRRADMAGDACR